MDDFANFMNLPEETDEEYFNVHELLNNEKNNVIVAICGCSGSGKSMFEKRLLYEGNDNFFKLPQITTRERRPHEKDGEDYYFVNHSTYNTLKPVLTAKLNNFNGNSYGTIPVFRDDKINTVIVSAEALVDLMDMYADTATIIVVLLDIEWENVTKDGNRENEGRDKKFFEQERETLKFAYDSFKDSPNVFSKFYKYEEHNNRFPLVTDVFDLT
jgi:guanylate kinase